MLIGNTCLTEKHLFNLFMFFFTFTLKFLKYYSRTISSQNKLVSVIRPHDN